MLSLYALVTTLLVAQNPAEGQRVARPILGNELCSTCMLLLHAPEYTLPAMLENMLKRKSV